MFRIAIAVALVFSLISVAPSALAREKWPSKPIRIIVPYPAGGAGDIVPRIIAQPLSVALKQPVIVENKPGADGLIGINAVAKADADGYTLGAATPGQLIIGKNLFPHIQYDPNKDIKPIILTYDTAFVLVVNASSPVHSIKDLFDWIKRNPGKLNIAIPGYGTLQHLYTEMMKGTAGIDILDIPYKNGAECINAVASGDVEMTWSAIPNAVPLIKSGKLRAIAVSGTSRDEALQNVPTLVESGWPSLVAKNWNALVVPSGTPESIVDRLNSEVGLILKRPEIIDKFRAMGITPLGGTVKSAIKFVKEEESRWNEVIKNQNIQAQ